MPILAYSLINAVYFWQKAAAFEVDVSFRLVLATILNL